MIDPVTRMPSSFRRNDIRYTDGGSPRPIFFPSRPRFPFPDNRVEADIKQPGDEERARVRTFARLNSNHYFEPTYADEHHRHIYHPDQPHVHLVPRGMIANGFPIIMPGGSDAMIRRFAYPSAVYPSAGYGYPSVSGNDDNDNDNDYDDDGNDNDFPVGTGTGTVYAPHGSNHLYSMPAFPPLPTEIHTLNRAGRTAVVDEIIARAKARRSSPDEFGLPVPTSGSVSIRYPRRNDIGGDARHASLQQLDFAMRRLEELAGRVAAVESGLGGTQVATLAVAAQIDARDAIANQRAEAVQRMKNCLTRFALQIANVERKLARSGIAVPMEADDLLTDDLLSDVDYPRDNANANEFDFMGDGDGDGQGDFLDHDIIDDDLIDFDDPVDDDGSPISLTIAGGTDGDFDIDFAQLFGVN